MKRNFLIPIFLLLVFLSAGSIAKLKDEPKIPPDVGLKQAIELLPPAKRRLAHCRRLGMSVPQIAFVLGSNETDVEDQLRQLNHELRRMSDVSNPFVDLNGEQKEAVLTMLDRKEREAVELYWRGWNMEEIALKQGGDFASTTDAYQRGLKKIGPTLISQVQLTKRVEQYHQESLIEGLNPASRILFRRVYDTLAPEQQAILIGYYDGVTRDKLMERLNLTSFKFYDLLDKAKEKIHRELNIPIEQIEVAVRRNFYREAQMPIDLFENLTVEERVRLGTALSRATPQSVRVLLATRDGKTPSQITPDNRSRAGATFRAGMAVVTNGVGKTEEELEFHPPDSRYVKALLMLPFFCDQISPLKRADLLDAIAALPEDAFEALRTAIHYKSARSMAEVLKISPSAVQRRLNLAKTLLSDKLKVEIDPWKMMSRPSDPDRPYKINESIFAKVPHEKLPAMRDALARLSLRRYEILAMAQKGLSHKQIGERLGISESTVSTSLTETFDFISEETGISRAKLKMTIPTLEERILGVPEEKAEDLALALAKLYEHPDYKEVRALIDHLRAGGNVTTMPERSSTPGVRLCKRMLGYLAEELKLDPGALRVNPYYRK